MRTFIKAICTAMALSLVILSFASCGKEYKTIYINDENGEAAAGFNENMLSFHMAMEKTTLLAQLGMTEDAPEIWNATLGTLLGEGVAPEYVNMTFAQYNDELAIESAKKMVAASYVYDSMKGENTVEGKFLQESSAKMEAQVDNIVSKLQLSVGSKEAFESFIGGAGINMEDFRKYYEMNYKTTELRSAVYVSEEEKKEYFKDNYAIVKHILINTASKTNEAGEKVSLNAAELEEKNAEVRTIEARLSAGEDFETVYAEYEGTDPGTALYTEGYFVTANGKFVEAFQNAALEMKEGEVRTVKTEYGVHIMKKYPMDENKYNLYSDTANEINTVLTNAAYSELLAPHIAKVQIDKDAASQYSMAMVSMLKPE